MGRAYYKRNKERIKAQNKAYQQQHPERVAIWNEHTRERFEFVKMKVFAHYSGGIPKCLYCNIIDMDVLCLDHIENNGKEDRRIRGTGHRLFAKLIKEKFPSGYQVLCFNCNRKKELKHLKVKREGGDASQNEQHPQTLGGLFREIMKRSSQNRNQKEDKPKRWQS